METQLREYFQDFDARLPAIELDDIVLPVREAPRESPPSPHRPWWRRGPAVALAALLLTVAIGGLLLLVQRGSSDDLAETPSTSTIAPTTTEAAPATTLPATTTVPSMTPTTVAQAAPAPPVPEIEWRQYGIAANLALAISDVVWLPDRELLVAVGSINVEDDEDGVVWTSPDGETWTLAARFDGGYEGNLRHLFDGPQRATAIAATEDGLIALGPVNDWELDQHSRDLNADRLAVWHSPDGSTWTEGVRDPALFDAEPEMYALKGGGIDAGPNVEPRINALANTSMGLIGVGENTFLCSDPAEGCTTGVFDTGVFVEGELYFEVGSAIWVSSDDGASWTTVDHRPWHVLWDILETPDGLLAAGVVDEGWGTDGGLPKILYSADALTWTEMSVECSGCETGRVRALASTPEGPVAVGSISGDAGDRGAVWRSTDGTAWELVTTLASADQLVAATLGDILQTGDLLIAVGTEGGFGDSEEEEGPEGWGVIWVSTDNGASWTLSARSATSGALTSVVAVGDRIVALGAGEYSVVGRLPTGG